LTLSQATAATAVMVAIVASVQSGARNTQFGEEDYHACTYIRPPLLLSSLCSLRSFRHAQQLLPVASPLMRFPRQKGAWGINPPQKIICAVFAFPNSIATLFVCLCPSPRGCVRIRHYSASSCGDIFGTMKESRGRLFATLDRICFPVKNSVLPW